MFIVRRALISVSDKRNLIPFARGLIDLGVEILSTGGTCRQLKEAGIDAVVVTRMVGMDVKITQGPGGVYAVPSPYYSSFYGYYSYSYVYVQTPPP